MKSIVAVIISIISLSTFAQSSLSFCPVSATGWNKDDCVASCSDLLVNGTGYVADSNGEGGNLSNGSVGFCYGRTSTFKYKIHKIAIGNESGLTCNIFNGDLTIDMGKSTPGMKLKQSSLNYSDCPAGTYDRIYLTVDRLTKISAQTPFPDNSGKVAKTTSTYADDSISGNVFDLSWLEDMSGGTYSSSGANSSKAYSRPGTTWSVAFKKVGLTPNSSGIDDDAVENSYDEWKGLYLNSLIRDISGNYTTSSTTNRDGDYYCETGDSGQSKDYCLKLDDDSSRLIIRLKQSETTDMVSGFPIKIDKKKNKPRIKISYYSAKRTSDNQEYGTRFFFKRDGSSAVFLGTWRGDDGMHITITNRQ